MKKTFNWWMDQVQDETYAFLNNAFTPDECRQIIDTGNNEYLSEHATAKVGHLGNLIVDENVRKCELSWIRSDCPDNHWIFQRLVSAVDHLNKKFFNFDLQYIESLQFTKYEEETELDKNGGFYKPHVDLMWNSTGTRKLSFSVQLSDPDTYQGGELIMNARSNDDLVTKDHGTLVAFPSYVLHEVTPVTKGVRYSLVGWTVGPKFK